MKKEILDLMKLQGEVKIQFIRKGVPENVAHDIAGEVLHLFTETEMMKEEHRTAYKQMNQEDFEG